MKLHFNPGVRTDGRYTLLRISTDSYVNGCGHKVSISFHNRLFKLDTFYREMFLTLFGLNIHYRG
jgi:hypothetical protein